MRFFYDSQSDLLGIRFKPGQGDSGLKQHEVMPGVSMGFDKQGALVQVEIRQASSQQPDLPQLVTQLVQELVQRTPEISKEALLAIEKTLRLGDDDEAGAEPKYQPGFSFDASNNVLVVEFFRPASRAELMPKKQILPFVFAEFDQQGHLVSMDIQSALQQFPDLGRFIQQGQELLAVQYLLRRALEP